MFVQITSVVHLNTLNLDPEPEFWPYLDPDPGLCYVIFKNRLAGKRLSFYKKNFYLNFNKVMAQDEIFSQLSL